MKLLLVVFLTLFCFIAVFYVIAGAVFGVPSYGGPRTDHFDGARFHNPGGTGAQRGLFRYLGMRLANVFHSNQREASWPQWVENSPQPKPPQRSQVLRITFINHATLLIQVDGVNILTDPQWSLRASPVAWLGPQRHRNPGVALEDLPPIDIVLISHNHYDHLDLPTLGRLESAFHPTVVAALGNSSLLEKHCSKVLELDWWQTASIENLKISSTPAQHFSARSVNDRNRALWCGFVIKGTRSIYFAGDTGYGLFFKEIGRRAKPDVALLPIGAYAPEWFMRPIHLNPREAFLAAIDLGVSQAVPMHFGTFQLSEEGIHEPIDELRRVNAEFERSAPIFHVLCEGEGKNL